MSMQAGDRIRGTVARETTANRCAVDTSGRVEREYQCRRVFSAGCARAAKTPIAPNATAAAKQIHLVGKRGQSRPSTV
jgi:hypothetical protein